MKIINRLGFKNFCEQNKLTIVYAGNDWADALVDARYLCAIIGDENDYKTIKPLIDNELVVLASCEIKNGNDWYLYNRFNMADFESDVVKHSMTEEYDQILSSNDNTVYYGKLAIEARDKALAAHPKLDGETDQEHFNRLEESSDDLLAPLYVDTPGYWRDGNLLLSDTEIRAGIWSYSHDNWTRRVLAVYLDRDYE